MGVIAAVLAIALLGADAAPKFSVGGGWVSVPVGTGTNPFTPEVFVGRYVLPQSRGGAIPNIAITRTPLKAASLDIRVSEFTHATLGMDAKLTSVKLDRCTLPAWLVTYSMTYNGTTSHVEREFVGYATDVYEVVYGTPDGIAVDNDAENAMRGFCGYH